MVIVKFIEDKLYSIGDEPYVRWYICECNDDAVKYTEKELAKIKNYNDNTEQFSLHRQGDYELLTPEQVKERSLYEVDTMSVGMLFKIMSHN